MARVLLEVCVDSPDGLAAAVAGGADRIELCAGLALGGLTPSPAFMALAAGCGVPVVAMVRPRAGDFAWSAGEVALMEREVAAVRAAGLAGVVVGASRVDGRLDLATLRRLLAAAEGLEVALHRAFDLAPDLSEALEDAAALGVARILTSGGATRAPEAVEVLAGLHAQAAGRLAVMPGSGVTADTVGALLAAAPFGEVHASCATPRPQDPRAAAMGFAAGPRRETSAEEVRRLRARLG
jgi:copper homeostasis protein